MRYCVVFATLLLAAGCYHPGGGGTVHHPPPQIIAGQATALKLDFSVWGAGSGDLSSRYTKIFCYYRQTGESQFQSVSARILSSDKKRMEVEFVIPAQTISGDSSTLEYYFDFFFDGHPNTREHESVQIVKPAA